MLVYRRKKAIRIVLLIVLPSMVGLAVLVAAVVVGFWWLRPNSSQINPALGMEVWTAVSDGSHNSTTDMIYWHDAFYLVHAASPLHMGTGETRLVLHKSSDAREWEVVREFSIDGSDVRDPKLAVIDDRLILYVLVNDGSEPAPYATAAAATDDGTTWGGFQVLEPRGWLFWRPKSRDGETWFTAAYWKERGRSILLRSSDGLAWELVGDIYEGDRSDETALEFLPDGRMLITARLEGDRGFHQGAKDAATLIGTSSAPFTDWTTTKDFTSRLDGPVLFTIDRQLYAVGRYDPEGYAKWYGNSSLLGRKRTAIYKVTPDQLVRLSDLSSCGDTSYPGVVIHDGYLFISYYTNRIDRDFSWLLGRARPTDIMIARIPTGNLFVARPDF